MPDNSKEANKIIEIEANATNKRTVTATIGDVRNFPKEAFSDARIGTPIPAMSIINAEVVYDIE